MRDVENLFKSFGEFGECGRLNGDAVRSLYKNCEFF